MHVIPIILWVRRPSETENVTIDLTIYNIKILLFVKFPYIYKFIFFENFNYQYIVH